MTDQPTPDWRTWSNCRPGTNRANNGDILSIYDWPLDGRANMSIELVHELTQKSGSVSVGDIGIYGDVQFVVDHLIYEILTALVHRIN